MLFRCQSCCWWSTWSKCRTTVVIFDPTQPWSRRVLPPREESDLLHATDCLFHICVCFTHQHTCEYQLAITAYYLLELDDCLTAGIVLSKCFSSTLTVLFYNSFLWHCTLWPWHLRNEHKVLQPFENFHKSFPAVPQRLAVWIQVATWHCMQTVTIAKPS